MFNAIVYKIMIGCPEDIKEEVEIAIRTIHRWTSINAEKEATILLPIHWTTCSYPEQGSAPQTIINKQLVTRSDLLIAIFGAKVGSPTDKSTSGTIEEIEEHIKANKPVMIFFRQTNNTANMTSSELETMMAFKSNIQKSYLYYEYLDVAAFEKAFSNALELFLANNWLANHSVESKEHFNSVVFNQDENNRIKKWVNSNNNRGSILNVLEGVIYFLGDDSYLVNQGRDKADWDDFIDRLLQDGLIKQIKIDKYGNPVFILQKRAYTLFDGNDIKNQ